MADSGYGYDDQWQSAFGSDYGYDEQGGYEEVQQAQGETEETPEEGEVPYGEEYPYAVDAGKDARKSAPPTEYPDPKLRGGGKQLKTELGIRYMGQPGHGEDAQYYEEVPVGYAVEPKAIALDSRHMPYAGYYQIHTDTPAKVLDPRQREQLRDRQRELGPEEMFTDIKMKVYGGGSSSSSSSSSVSLSNPSDESIHIPVVVSSEGHSHKESEEEEEEEEHGSDYSKEEKSDYDEFGLTDEEKDTGEVNDPTLGRLNEIPVPYATQKEIEGRNSEDIQFLEEWKKDDALNWWYDNELQEWFSDPKRVEDDSPDSRLLRLYTTFPGDVPHTDPRVRVTYPDYFMHRIIGKHTMKTWEYRVRSRTLFEIRLVTSKNRLKRMFPVFVGWKVQTFGEEETAALLEKKDSCVSSVIKSSSDGSQGLKRRSLRAQESQELQMQTSIRSHLKNDVSSMFVQSKKWHDFLQKEIFMRAWHRRAIVAKIERNIKTFVERGVARKQRITLFNFMLSWRSYVLRKKRIIRAKAWMRGGLENLTGKKSTRTDSVGDTTAAVDTTASSTGDVLHSGLESTHTQSITRAGNEFLEKMARMEDLMRHANEQADLCHSLHLWKFAVMMLKKEQVQDIASRAAQDCEEQKQTNRQLVENFKELRGRLHVLNEEVDRRDQQHQENLKNLHDDYSAREKEFMDAHKDAHDNMREALNNMHNTETKKMALEHENIELKNRLKALENEIKRQQHNADFGVCPFTSESCVNPHCAMHALDFSKTTAGGIATDHSESISEAPHVGGGVFARIQAERKKKQQEKEEKRKKQSQAGGHDWDHEGDDYYQKIAADHEVSKEQETPAILANSDGVHAPEEAEWWNYWNNDEHHDGEAPDYDVEWPVPSPEQSPKRQSELSGRIYDHLVSRNYPSKAARHVSENFDAQDRSSVAAVEALLLMGDAPTPPRNGARGRYSRQGDGPDTMTLSAKDKQKDTGSTTSESEDPGTWCWNQVDNNKAKAQQAQQAAADYHGPHYKDDLIVRTISEDTEIIADHQEDMRDDVGSPAEKLHLENPLRKSDVRMSRMQASLEELSTRDLDEIPIPEKDETGGKMIGAGFGTTEASVLREQRGEKPSQTSVSVSSPHGIKEDRAQDKVISDMYGEQVFGKSLIKRSEWRQYLAAMKKGYDWLPSQAEVNSHLVAAAEREGTLLDEVSHLMYKKGFQEGIHALKGGDPNRPSVKGSDPNRLSGKGKEGDRSSRKGTDSIRKSSKGDESKGLDSSTRDRTKGRNANRSSLKGDDLAAADKPSVRSSKGKSKGVFEKGSKRKGMSRSSEKGLSSSGFPPSESSKGSSDVRVSLRSQKCRWDEDQPPLVTAWTEEQNQAWNKGKEDPAKEYDSLSQSVPSYDPLHDQPYQEEEESSSDLYSTGRMAVEAGSPGTKPGSSGGHKPSTTHRHTDFRHASQDEDDAAAERMLMPMLDQPPGGKSSKPLTLSRKSEGKGSQSLLKGSQNLSTSLTMSMKGQNMGVVGAESGDSDINLGSNALQQSPKPSQTRGKLSEGPEKQSVRSRTQSQTSPTRSDKAAKQLKLSLKKSESSSKGSDEFEKKMSITSQNSPKGLEKVGKSTVQTSPKGSDKLGKKTSMRKSFESPPRESDAPKGEEWSVEKDGDDWNEGKEWSEGQEWSDSQGGKDWSDSKGKDWADSKGDKEWTDSEDWNDNGWKGIDGDTWTGKSGDGKSSQQTGDWKSSQQVGKWKSSAVAGKCNEEDQNYDDVNAGGFMYYPEWRQSVQSSSSSLKSVIPSGPSSISSQTPREANVEESGTPKSAERPRNMFSLRTEFEKQKKLKGAESRSVASSVEKVGKSSVRSVGEKAETKILSQLHSIVSPKDDSVKVQAQVTAALSNVEVKTPPKTQTAATDRKVRFGERSAESKTLMNVIFDFSEARKYIHETDRLADDFAHLFPGSVQNRYAVAATAVATGNSVLAGSSSSAPSNRSSSAGGGLPKDSRNTAAPPMDDILMQPSAFRKDSSGSSSAFTKGFSSWKSIAIKPAIKVFSPTDEDSIINSFVSSVLGSKTDSSIGSKTDGARSCNDGVRSSTDESRSRQANSPSNAHKRKSNYSASDASNNHLAAHKDDLRRAREMPLKDREKDSRKEEGDDLRSSRVSPMKSEKSERSKGEVRLKKLIKLLKKEKSPTEAKRYLKALFKKK